MLTFLHVVEALLALRLQAFTVKNIKSDQWCLGHRASWTYSHKKRKKKCASLQMQHSQDIAPLQALQPAPPASVQSSPASQYNYHDSPWADLHTVRKIMHIWNEPCWGSHVVSGGTKVAWMMWLQIKWTFVFLHLFQSIFKGKIWARKHL